MHSFSETFSRPVRAGRARAPFSQPDADATQFGPGEGAVAVRIVVIAASILLALAAQWTAHPFDAGWMLAALAVFAVFAALLALCLRNIGAVGADISAAWRHAAERRAGARADRRFLARAEHDPRLMADLQMALARHEYREELSPSAQSKIEQAARRPARAQWDRAAMPL